MNESVKKSPERQPPSLGNTLFLSGACIGIGLLAFLIGIGVIPSGSVQHTAASYLIAAGVGALFVFAGLMILVRDLGGAKNNEDLPANAPAFFRLAASLLNILLLATFASVASIIALGALPDLQRQLGSLAILFRIFMGAFALLFWYGAIYLAISKVKDRGT